MRTLRATWTHLRFCCGVVEIGNFGYGVACYDTLDEVISQTRYGVACYDTLDEVISQTRDYVYKIATFIDSPECRRAYERMCSKLQLVSQTEPKRNPNSGNLVFVAVFTNKPKGKK